MSEQVTRWVTKYALTEGIKQLEGAITYRGNFSSGRYFAFRKDIHATREEACAAAERMRVRKIASLRKQIAKLEAMRFE